MANQIVIEIIGDSSKFSKATDEAVTKGGKFGDLMKGGLMGVGMAGFNLAAGAVQGFIGSLGDADKAYQEDMRSQGLLRASLEANVKGFDGNTDAIESLISSRMNLAFGDEELRDSMGNLVAITHDVTDAQELQATAMDLARLKGMDLSTASDLVGKVYGGNLGTLSRYGIILDENATKEEALAAIQAMAAGQAQAYADGPLGVQEVAQNKVGESMEKIGEIVNTVSSVVLPIAADAFANVVDWLSKTWKEVEPVVGTLIKDLTPAFKTVVGILGDVAGIIGNVVKVVLPPFISIVKFLASVWANVFGGIWNVAKTVFGNVTDTVTGIVRFFTGLPDKIGRAVKGLWDSIPKAFKAAINILIGVWNKLGFTMPVIDLPVIGKIGGFRIGVPQIPYLHSGGVVPGTPGTDVLAMLQAGERVLPRSRSGSGSDITIIFNGPVYGDGINELTDKIALQLRLQGVTN